MSYKPTKSMKDAAARGLRWREEYGRGGTDVGVARARDIVNGKNLSESTVKRMFSFFSRHKVNNDKHYSAKESDGGPTAHRIAWDLWGGSNGYTWSKNIVEKLNADGGERSDPMQSDEKSDIMPEERVEDMTVEIEGIDPDAKLLDEFRAEPDELSVGDWVSWNSSGGEAYGQIESIERDGTIDVPDADVTVSGDEDDPAALIEVYREGEGGWEASGVMVAHKFSTLTKEARRGYKDKDERHIVEIQETESEIIITYAKHDEGEGSEERFDREKMDFRAMAEVESAIDEEKRTANMVVSTEEPVDRSFGAEILDHSPESIDLSFAKSGRMPFLLDHDPKQQIGVVEDVRLDGLSRKLRAKVRFGKNGLAKEAFEDVVDGIRSNISVGYQVNKMDKEGADSYRVKSWFPMEISLVSIPADRKAGIGRSASENLQTQPAIPKQERKNEMSEENQIDIDAVKADAARAAAKDTAEMYRLAAKHNVRDIADQFVGEGRSLNEFRGELLNHIGNKPIDNDAEAGLSKQETRRYSVMNVVRALANPADRAAQKAAAFELEASYEAARAAGREAQGVMVPAEVLRNWKVRDLNTSDDSAVIGEDFRAGDFVDVLRNASSVMAAGATMLNGLSGDVKIPKKTAASSAGWIATEGGASSESEPTVGQITMSPKVVGHHTDITRLMMQQSSIDVEAMVRNDIAAGIAQAIDLGALAGSGSSGQPTGVSNTSCINAPTSFAAANPTFAEVVAMETAVAEDNALGQNMAYILPASMYGALKTTAKDSGSGMFVVEPDGRINGYNAIVSNQVTAGDLYFGAFENLLIGMWGGLDLVVDPYTNSTSGTVRVVGLQPVDVAVRHAVAFAYNNDGS